MAWLGGWAVGPIIDLAVWRSSSVALSRCHLGNVDNILACLLAQDHATTARIEVVELK